MSAVSTGAAARWSRGPGVAAHTRTRSHPRCSSRCSSWSSTSARPARSSRPRRPTSSRGRATPPSSCPASLLLAGLVRHGGALPGGGHRGRLLRQAARRADLAQRAGHRPAAGRGAEEPGDHRPCWSCWPCRSGSGSPAACSGSCSSCVLTALWAVVYAGFMQLIALKSRSAAATNSGSMVFFPLLFLTPSFVPRDMLTRPMEIAASCNPVTYIMEALRSLILEGFDWADGSASAPPCWCSRRADGGAQRALGEQLRLIRGGIGSRHGACRCSPGRLTLLDGRMRNGAGSGSMTLAILGGRRQSNCRYNGDVWRSRSETRRTDPTAGTKLEARVFDSLWRTVNLGAAAEGIRAGTKAHRRGDSKQPSPPVRESASNTCGVYRDWTAEARQGRAAADRWWSSCPRARRAARKPSHTDEYRRGPSRRSSRAERTPGGRSVVHRHRG